MNKLLSNKSKTILFVCFVCVLFTGLKMARPCGLLYRKAFVILSTSVRLHYYRLINTHLLAAPCPPSEPGGRKGPAALSAHHSGISAAGWPSGRSAVHRPCTGCHLKWDVTNSCSDKPWIEIKHLVWHEKCLLSKQNQSHIEAFLHSIIIERRKYRNIFPMWNSAVRWKD